MIANAVLLTTLNLWNIVCKLDLTALNVSRTRSFTYPFTHSLSHSLTHSLSHTHTHTLTHSFTLRCPSVYYQVPTRPSGTSTSVTGCIFTGGSDTCTRVASRLCDTTRNAATRTANASGKSVPTASFHVSPVDKILPPVSMWATTHT